MSHKDDLKNKKKRLKHQCLNIKNTQNVHSTFFHNKPIKYIFFETLKNGHPRNQLRSPLIDSKKVHPCNP